LVLGSIDDALVALEANDLVLAVETGGGSVDQCLIQFPDEILVQALSLATLDLGDDIILVPFADSPSGQHRVREHTGLGEISLFLDKPSFTEEERVLENHGSIFWLGRLMFNCPLAHAARLVVTASGLSGCHVSELGWVHPG